MLLTTALKNVLRTWCFVIDPKIEVSLEEGLCLCHLQYTPGKYEISRRENRCILKIKNVDKDDAAEFACEVEGDKTICKVTVEGQKKQVVFCLY